MNFHFLSVQGSGSVLREYPQDSQIREINYEKVLISNSSPTWFMKTSYSKFDELLSSDNVFREHNLWKYCNYRKLALENLHCKMLAEKQLRSKALLWEEPRRFSSCYSDWRERVNEFCCVQLNCGNWVSKWWYTRSPYRMKVLNTILLIAYDEIQADFSQLQNAAP